MLPDLLNVLQRTNEPISLEEICKRLPQSESYENIVDNQKELLSSASKALQLGARFGLIYYDRRHKYKIAVDHTRPEAYNFYRRLRILNEDIEKNGLKNSLANIRDHEGMKASPGKKRNPTSKQSSSVGKKSGKGSSSPKRTRK